MGTIRQRILHNRPVKLLPRPQNIIHHRKQHHREGHQHAIIHRTWRDRRIGREETEYEDDNPEYDCEEIHSYAPDSGEMERPPD